MRVSSKLLLAGIFLSVSLFLIHNHLAGIGGIFGNKGVSFGVNIPYITIVNTILMTALMIFFLKRSEFVGLFVMVLGGVVNLIDRIVFGYVRDYWNLFNSGIYNNVNDWVIGIGVLIFIVEIIWKKRLA